MSSLFVLGAQRKMFSTEGFKLSDRKLTIYWKMIMWKNGLCIILWWIDLTFLINAVECYHFSSSFPKSIQIFTSIELCLCCICGYLQSFSCKWCEVIYLWYMKCLWKYISYNSNLFFILSFLLIAIINLLLLYYYILAIEAEERSSRFWSWFRW